MEIESLLSERNCRGRISGAVLVVFSIRGSGGDMHRLGV